MVLKEGIYFIFYGTQRRDIFDIFLFWNIAILEDVNEMGISKPS